MIDLQKIDIGYKTKLFTINNIELVSGQMYALIGANGSGKTTFLKSIIGINQSLKGEVIVGGVPISKLNRIEKAKTISYVGSKFDGVDFLRVKDCIALGRTPYTNVLGRLSSADIDIVEETIVLLQIENLQDKFTNELSDGERQLVAIGRAIAQQTEIIILDEPTAFLDYANRKTVIDLMKRISIELNKCIIISSHDLELCLESEIDMIVINKKKSELTYHKANSLSKNELIEIGF